nr:hypothetical protein [uncultured Carboxylicivirga sp.]
MKSFISSLIIFTLFLAQIYSQNNKFTTLPSTDLNIRDFIVIDQDQLYYPDNGKILVWDLSDNILKKTFESVINETINSIITNAASDYLVAGTNTGEVYIFSKVSKELINKIKIDDSEITCLNMITEENKLFIGCSNGNLYEMNIDEIGTTKLSYHFDGPVTSIDFSKSLGLLAITSGDGTINIFRSPAFEWLRRMEVSKKWVRDISFNNFKNRLCAVGDDGKLFEWKVTQSEDFTLLDEENLSGNWLLTMDISDDGKLLSVAGLNQKLLVRSDFGTYDLKLKAPITKIQIIRSNSKQIQIVCSLHGRGIQIIPVAKMNFKSTF